MDWTDQMDRTLIDGVAAGRSRGQIARRLGVSRFAAIARYNRLMGVVFPSDKERGKLEKQERLERERERNRVEREAIARMQDSIAKGAPRNPAMKTANKQGATLATIASCFGISRQAVHQAVKREG